MKAKSTKRLFALLVALAMVAVLLPVSILNAHAEDTVTQWDFRLDDFTGQSPYNGLTITVISASTAPPTA